ncbi:TetR/AcrR family transcriptional regulator [Paenibacillus sp. MMS20-IR301]|uniref:TetR/AcrR family transcriptional regulator n=1 Tax=Paenibacillus sp. MMS20-IR301 TaxID=2895946 RepID=UPI0028EACC61|nr:TetR/AcrR family transcriptional regulator [Paenibacillus sp. MMS20-IR301]WNS42877.1 TetR/AcrR family transcriptional regulator [Paenibacillus sp. MMS20-IR301]
MDKFINLAEDKQTQIIDGALAAFSANGYKKTSVSDIAAAAGISKAMVFHYFGTKKDLYLYLIDFGSGIIIEAIQEKFDRSITDFFDRIRMATAIKIAAMERHPAILSFFTSVFFESDREVKQEIKAKLASGEGFRNKLALEGMDVSKFKDGVDPKMVMKLLVRYSEGFVNELPGTAVIDPAVIAEEFEACIVMLRNNLYKEEHLI